MKLNEIKKEIINHLKTDLDIYSDVLGETNPYNYGVNSWEVEIEEKKLYINNITKEFKFNNSEFYSNLKMGAFKGETSYDITYNKPMNGKGKFVVNDDNAIIITEINIEIDKSVLLN